MRATCLFSCVRILDYIWSPLLMWMRFGFFASWWWYCVIYDVCARLQTLLLRDFCVFVWQCEYYMELDWGFGGKYLWIFCLPSNFFPLRFFFSFHRSSKLLMILRRDDVMSSYLMQLILFLSSLLYFEFIFGPLFILNFLSLSFFASIHSLTYPNM